MTNATSKDSTGSGTARLYYVEARSTHNEPRVCNGVPLTLNWRRLHTRRVPGGALVEAAQITVPSEPFHPHADDLLQREAAQALATRFQIRGDGYAELCVETRLVEVELTWSYRVHEIGVCEPFSLFDQMRWLKSTPRGVDDGRIESSEAVLPSKSKDA